VSVKVILDTSVIIEYINRAGKLHKQASTIFKALNEGRLRAAVPSPVLAETFYVAVRIYSSMGLPDPVERAEKLVNWIDKHPQVDVLRNFDLDLEAGKMKLKYGVSLTDCYVLAASKIHKAKAVFRKREKEMESIEDLLRKELEVIFLEDYF
jgi:Predicted nucleic acid-binding protein, contains PIN domain